MIKATYKRPVFSKADMKAPRLTAGNLLRQLDDYCARMGILEPAQFLKLPKQNVRIVGAFLLALALPAYAGDVTERAQIPTKSTTPDGHVRYASRLIPAAAFAMPLFQLAQSTPGGSSTLPAAGVFTTSMTVGTAADAANSVTIAAGTPSTMCWEGATADAFETCLTVVDPTVGDQTWTIPNAGAGASRTFASLEAAQSFTAVNTFTSRIDLTTSSASVLFFGAAFGRLGIRSENTPDILQFTTGTTSNSLNIMEDADIAFDFNNGGCGTSACTDPTLILRSHNQDVDEFIQLSNNGTRGEVRAGNSGQAGADLELDTGGLTRAYYRAGTLAVADNTATTMFTITLGDDTDAGGTISFCAMATSAATDRQKTCGEINFSATDVTAGAGGEVCNSVITGANSTAPSTGTLTVTTASTTGTDLCNVQITSDSSLNVAHTVRWSVTSFHGSAAAVTINPQ